VEFFKHYIQSNISIGLLIQVIVVVINRKALVKIQTKKKISLNYQINLDGNRPTRDQIIEMRRFMLLYLKQLVIKSSGTQEEELQAIINYLHTVHEVKIQLFLF
jgi:hypothetical protein